MMSRPFSVIALTIFGTGIILAALSWFGLRPLPGDVALSRMVQAMLASDSLSGRIFANADVLVWVAALLVIVTLMLRRRIVSAVLIVLAVATSLVLGGLMLKPLVARPRPSVEFAQVAQDSDSYGFPSTTTLVAVVLGGTLIYLAREKTRRAAYPVRARRAILPVTVGALGLILLTSMSRIYAGEHWPSDVLGSWLVGSCWTLCLIQLHRWWAGRSVSRPLRTT